MSQNAPAEIVIRIDTIDQLFNAPAIDPFSDKPSVILGEAALPYAIRQQLSRGMRDWKGRCLVIQLPPDQITPDLQSKTIEAIRRFSAAKRQENDGLVHISRWRSLIGLIVAFIVAGLFMISVTILVNTVLASASDTLKGVLTGVTGIFVWAIVWNPFDRLVYEWIGPWLENRILRNLMTMDIVIRPEPSIL